MLAKLHKLVTHYKPRKITESKCRLDNKNETLRMSATPKDMPKDMTPHQTVSAKLHYLSN